METSFFSRNTDALNERFPLLAEELSRAEQGAEELLLEAALSGAPTLLIRSGGGDARPVYVHSRRDPEREALRLVESAVPPEAADERIPALVLGFGLGYAALALAAKFPEKPIIVVEKRAEILKKAFETRDFTDFLLNSRLVFVLGGDGGGVSGALSLFEGIHGVSPPLIQNRPLVDLDAEWYSGVEERVKAWNTRANVNRATQRRFGKRWVRNLSKNMDRARDFPGISRLEGILKGRGIPVFLAAAGPTLDDAGPILREIYGRCLVVAVDTSLRFLLARGVDPDFVVSVDPQYWNFRHLDRQTAPKTFLVAESAVYPPVLRHKFAGVFLCASFFPLGRFIEERLEPKGELGAGGSVATSAWDFARILGAEELWIAGLDLSFPELKTHFRGALFEEKSHAESRRFFPAETWNFRALRDGQPFRAKRCAGGTVLTDKRLSLYASWFESRFAQFPELRNFSLSGEGLALKGLTQGELHELLARPSRREEIDALLAEGRAALTEEFNSGEAADARREKYERARENLLGGLLEIESEARRAAKTATDAASLHAAGRLGEKERKKALEKLDAADKFIEKSTVKEIAGFLFPETSGWEAEVSAEKPDPLGRHLDFSARFYTALARAAAYNLQVLKNENTKNFP